MAKTVADQQADQSKQQRSAAGECPVNADPRTHEPNRDATEGAHAHREHVVDADRPATHFRRRIQLHQGLRHRIERQLDEAGDEQRSEEHTSELQSLMRLSYAVFCLKKKKNKKINHKQRKQTKSQM